MGRVGSKQSAVSRLPISFSSSLLTAYCLLPISHFPLPMSIDLTSINTSELKARVGELRRYL